MTTPILALNDKTPGIRLDLNALIVSRALIQANSGGGKSRALRALLEGTHGKVQQFVFDPEGEFASLRERFDYVLAGEEGDVPAHPSSARVLCRRLMELNASAVLNVFDLSLADRRRFVRSFLEELMSLPRDLWRPLLVVIDEAHVYCPENGQGQSESSEAVKTLCAQGRKRGFCAVLATQRLSKLHKDAAAELLNKLIGRTGLDVDVKRAADELGFNKEQTATLKRLEPGEFYAYGPAISTEVMLVQSGAVVTSHPEAGKLLEYAKMAAPPGLKKVLSALADIPAQAEQEARTVAQLQEQLETLRSASRLAASNRKTEIVEKIVERMVEVPVLAEHEAHELRETAHECLSASKDLFAVAERLRENGTTILKKLDSLKAASPGMSTHATPEAAPIARALPVSAPKPRREENSAAPSMKPVKRNEAVTAPQQRILDALRSFMALGLADVARLALTAEGIRVSQASAPISSLSQLHEAWCSRLPRPQANIIRALLRVYPKALGRDVLADNAGQSATSSGYTNNLGALRTLGLVNYPQSKMVAATSLLFPEGLA